MPGEQVHSSNQSEAARELDGTLARWNARANAAYLDIADLMGAVQDDFEGLATLAAKRDALAPMLAVDRALLQSAEHDATCNEARQRLAGLAESIATFHIELQTLHAQVRRSIGAGEALAEETQRLAQTGAALPVGPNPNLIGLTANVTSKTVREAQLASQVDTLRAELLRVKAELSDTRAQAAARQNVPADTQNEIARLRSRVLELMAEQSAPKTPRPMDLSLQYERILAQASDDEGRRRRMGDLLVAAGVLTDEQLDAALREQQTSWNRHLGAVLVDLGYVNEDTVAQALAAQIRVPYVRLIHETPTPEALNLVSKALAHHHSFVPLRFERDILVVAMANPMDLVAIDDIELATRRSIKPVVASAAEIKAALKEHYR